METYQGWDRVVADAAPCDHIVQFCQDQDNRTGRCAALTISLVQKIGQGSNSEQIRRFRRTLYKCMIDGILASAYHSTSSPHRIGS